MRFLMDIIMHFCDQRHEILESALSNKSIFHLKPKCHLSKLFFDMYVINDIFNLISDATHCNC